MAITDAGQICESTALTRTTRMTLSGNVKAGALMTLGIGSSRSNYPQSVSAITDSQGGVWDWKTVGSTTKMASTAWCRTGVPLQSGVDWIEVVMAATPNADQWITGHNFEGASGTPTDEGTNASLPGSSTASKSVAVTGSDFLVLATVMYTGTSVTTTPLNSMTEQDVHDGGDWHGEFLSRNHTSGSTFTAGTTFSSSRSWNIAVVSFPFQALPAAASGRSAIGLFGAV